MEWFSVARDEGASTTILYTMHGYSTLTGGQPALYDRLQIGACSHRKGLLDFGCASRARLDCKRNVNRCRAGASLWKLLGPSDEFTTRELRRRSEDTASITSSSMR